MSDSFFPSVESLWYAISEISKENNVFILDERLLQTLFQGQMPGIGQNLNIDGKNFKFLGHCNLKEFFVVVCDEDDNSYKLVGRNVVSGKQTEEALDLTDLKKIKVFADIKQADFENKLQELLSLDWQFSCVICENLNQIIDSLFHRVKHFFEKTGTSIMGFKGVDIVCLNLYEQYIHKKFDALSDKERDKVVIYGLDNFFEKCLSENNQKIFKTKRIICLVGAMFQIYFRQPWQNCISQFLSAAKSPIFLWELQSDQDLFEVLEEKWNCRFISLGLVPYLSNRPKKEVSKYPEEYKEVLFCELNHSLIFIKDREILIDTLCFKAKKFLDELDYVNSRNEIIIVCREEQDIFHIQDHMQRVYPGFKTEDESEINICAMKDFFELYSRKNALLSPDFEKLSREKKVVFFFDCLSYFAENHIVLLWLKDLFEKASTIKFLWEFNEPKESLKSAQSMGLAKNIELIFPTNIKFKEKEPEPIPPQIEVQEIPEELPKIEEPVIVAAPLPPPPPKMEPYVSPPTPVPRLYNPPKYINDQLFLLQLNKEATQDNVRTNIMKKKIKWFYGPVSIGFLLFLLIIIICCA